MTIPIMKKSDINYYEANHDWAGDRELADTHEIIQFHKNSTVRIWYNEQNYGFEPHWHTAMEIILPVENYYDADVNKTSYRIHPGEILVIPMSEIHSLTAPENGKRFIFLFDMNLITKLKSFSGLQPLLIQPLYMTRDTHPHIYDAAYDTLMQIKDEYFRQNEFAELKIYSLLLNLFAKIGQNYLQKRDLFSNIGAPKQKEYIKRFNNLLDYIDTHCTEDLNLENVASLAGFSKFHFSRLFKQYTSLTFNEYLNHRRLKTAEELLAVPGLSITEVSMRSGYTSLSTFNRLFKQVKHCTPTEYRAKGGMGL
nr:AraC family transcriptional regulator [uncultured Acetatifactor sp.]